MSDQQTHAARWEHHRQPRRIQDPWAEGGIVDIDRDEARAADQFDRVEYRRVGGRLMDADEVPDLADVVDGAW